MSELARVAGPGRGGRAARGRGALRRPRGLRADRGGRARRPDRRARPRPGGGRRGRAVRGRRAPTRRGRRRKSCLQACHAALLQTRGVVMTVAWFDLERARLSWAGVGNVDARLVRRGRSCARTSRSSSAACSATGCRTCARPRCRSTRGDLLVMITDGIDGAISPALAGGGAPRRWPTGSSPCTARAAMTPWSWSSDIGNPGNVYVPKLAH